jgi:hypothetical protein
MREKFKSIVNEWQLDTDPLKHVFEVGLLPIEVGRVNNPVGHRNRYISHSSLEENVHTPRYQLSRE